MPELPEVETIKRQISEDLVDAEVIEADSHESAKFTPAREIVGTKLGELRRRGKFLIVSTDDDRELIVHLGMTGKLRLVETPTEDKYIRAWWKIELESGAYQFLEFSDVRRFGRIKVVKTGDYKDMATLNSMGPEPFDEKLDNQTFWENLKKSKRHVKTNLLSQKPIAGVGNIYADEALWHAQINPKAKTISKKKAEKLLVAIRQVLQQGIDNGGTTLRDYRDAYGQSGSNQRQLYAYGRSGEECFRCSKIMKSDTIDARTTTWCPQCQKK